MLDSMFQEGTDKVLDDRVARPLQEPTAQPSFGVSAWRTVAAPFKGVGVGLGMEAPAGVADLAKTFGLANLLYDDGGAPGAIGSGINDVEVPDDLRRRTLERFRSGEAYSSETGTGLRATAREFYPDPATASTAEEILFGLGRFGGKAVGYSLMGGPVAGAALTGIDEGMTEADRLKAEGVDLRTRTKVGAVSGLSAAAATLLPVAGKTVKQTAALVAAGGPGSFIAQQAASRAILDNAGYEKIADQYDPLDPVGLAVSTLVPAAFGAYALRGRRVAAARATAPLTDIPPAERTNMRYDDVRLDDYAVQAAQAAGVPPEALLAIKNAGEKSNSTAVSRAGAKGVMQLIDDTWQVYGKGDPTDPVASIDAAARYMADLIKQYDGNVRAAIAHYNGGTKAGRAVMEGKAPPAAETRAYLERTDAYMAERQGAEAGRLAATDPEAVAAARVNLVRETVDSWNLGNPADVRAAESHLNAILAASDQISRGAAVDVGGFVPLDTVARGNLLDTMISRLESARADLLPDAGNMAEPGTIRALRQELAELRNSAPQTSDEAVRALAKEIQARDGRSYKASLAAAKQEVAARLADHEAQIARIEQQLDTNRRAQDADQQVRMLDQQIDQVRQERAALDAPPAMKPAALAVKEAVAGIPASKPATPAGGRTLAATQPAKVASEVASEVASDGMGALPNLDAQTGEIAALSPDLMVQLEGMDKPMRLADALAAVKQEADAEAQNAPLFQVAAECFLRAA